MREFVFAVKCLVSQIIVIMCVSTFPHAGGRASYPRSYQIENKKLLSCLTHNNQQPKLKPIACNM